MQAECCISSLCSAKFLEAGKLHKGAKPHKRISALIDLQLLMNVVPHDLLYLLGDAKCSADGLYTERGAWACTLPTKSMYVGGSESESSFSSVGSVDQEAVARAKRWSEMQERKKKGGTGLQGRAVAWL